MFAFVLSMMYCIFIPIADGSNGFKAEQGRYHLYVSLACPFAHQTLIVRKLKGLEDVISTTVVDWFVTEKGWSFTDKVRKRLYLTMFPFPNMVVFKLYFTI